MPIDIPVFIKEQNLWIIRHKLEEMLSYCLFCEEGGRRGSAEQLQPGTLDQEGHVQALPLHCVLRQETLLCLSSPRPGVYINEC